MDKALAILITLLTYKVTLIVIGVWASKRTKNEADFFLGGKRLGPLVAAISASASSSSAWTLLGVSGAAFTWGLSAVWLFPATVLGFLFNWSFIGPRLMRLSRSGGQLTLSEVIAGNPGHRLFQTNIRVCATIILFSFAFYVASQFQAAGNAFATTFDLGINESILIGGGIIVLYTLLGGFWAVSVTDTLQGLLMAAAAVLLPVAALVAVGGPGDLLAGLRDQDVPQLMRFSGARTGILALGFIIGTLGIGLGYPGQPHVVNRYMALRDQDALRIGRRIAMSWAVIVYSGMLVLGWCGRVLYQDSVLGEQVMLHAADALLPPVLAGIVIAAILSAVMSTADSQLLVAASSVAYDWRIKSVCQGESLLLTRVVVLILSVLAICLAIFAPDTIFRRVLFAWAAVGSAFGPLVILRVVGIEVREGFILATLISGFGLTILLHSLPDTPGDILERLLPFVVAMLIALAGRHYRESA